MTFEEFADIAAGLQSVAVTIAVIAGGAWALYQFRTLKTVEKAKADLDKTRRELLERGILDVYLRPESLVIDGSYYIHVQVELRNIGTGTEVIRWDDSKIWAAPIRKGADGKVALGAKSLGEYSRVDVNQIFTTVAAGQADHHSLLVPVGAPGLYLIDAQLMGSPGASAENLEEARAAGVTADNVVWGGTTYVTVIPEKSPEAA